MDLECSSPVLSQNPLHWHREGSLYLSRRRMVPGWSTLLPFTSFAVHQAPNKPFIARHHSRCPPRRLILQYSYLKSLFDSATQFFFLLLALQCLCLHSASICIFMSCTLNPTPSLPSMNNCKLICWIVSKRVLSSSDADHQVLYVRWNFWETRE
jgi:hypothetical protein